MNKHKKGDISPKACVTRAPFYKWLKTFEHSKSLVQSVRTYLNMLAFKDMLTNEQYLCYKAIHTAFINHRNQL